jgi:murein DD-endopeptidase MepM/ murein hydrolase activator NlpD
MKKSITLTMLMVLSLVSAACSNFVGYGNSTDANFNQEVLFVPPVKEGRIIHVYGWQRDLFTDAMTFHNGVDFKGAFGTPVMAAMGGTVCMAAWSHIYGKYIIIDHGNDFHSFYAHLSVVLVEKGDKVDERNKIGEIGNTGYSSGPHLHFAIYKDGKAVNPHDFLGKKREVQKDEWKQTEKTQSERKMKELNWIQ